MPYDVRAIRFIKTTADNPIKDNQRADYICLGHFDMMQIDELKCKEGALDYPLERIRKDRLSGREGEIQCPENFLNSLYVLKCICPEEAREVDGFWDAKSTFTVVTRIHCKYFSDSRCPQKPFSTIIEAYCRKMAKNIRRGRNKPKDTCVVMLNGVMNSKTHAVASVKCLFYDSLELGDTVAIMKSNSLAAILDIIRNISNEQCVKDTYSYCGIRRAFLQSKDPIPKSCYEASAVLEHVSTRFSVRSNRYSREYFEALEKNLCGKKNIWKKLSYVTGTADHIIHWGNCSEQEFLQIIQSLSQLSDRMHRSFNDVITRVGIWQPKSDSSCSGSADKDDSEYAWVQRLESTMQWLRSDIKSERSPSWKYTLLKLLGTLKTMSNNYVMDDLTQLIIPGVDAFLERIDYLRMDNNGEVPESYDLDISEFLDYWTSLSNDIAQLESQLTQHPELSPVRYYIPAMLLQFELRFVMKVCEALTDNEARRFRPMLIPSGMENLNTICILDPKSNLYKGTCPLLVFIPIRDLYRPWETAHRITHEMAHYCEDAGRNRNKRHEMMFSCIAYQIVEHWYGKFLDGTIESNYADQAYERSIDYIETLTANLMEIAEELCPHQGDWYLLSSKTAITVAVKEVLQDSRHVKQYIQTVYPRYFYSHSHNWINNVRLFQNEINQEESISEHIDLLTSLCAECYADLAMALLLNCDFETYYLCVYHDEYLHLKEHYEGVVEPPLANSVRPHIQRMALMIMVMSTAAAGKETWKIDDIRSKFAEKYPWVKFAINEAELIGDEWRTLCTPGEIPPCLTPEEIRRMSDYLAQCAKMLKDKLEGRKYGKRHHVVQQLRKNINFVNAEQFDWDAIRKFLCQDDASE